ncbi:MAG: hypothetical protein E6J82_06325 [Deltaproteobacteria bacterium]|nr:MAG: hypothetical protein E6J82_06325 [Deltaproteobacteria bacterium]
MDIAGQSGSFRDSVQGIPMEMAVESEFFSTSTKRGPWGCACATAAGGCDRGGKAESAWARSLPRFCG